MTSHNARQSVEMLQYEPVAGYGVHRKYAGEDFWVQTFVSPYNSRIRVLGYEASNYAALAKVLIMSALSETLGKIFAKVPSTDVERFRLLGFEEEAIIPGYFNGNDAMVMSYFTDTDRKISSLSTAEKQTVTAAVANVPKTSPPTLPTSYRCRPAEYADAGALAELFRKSFESYPFPVFEKEFIRQTMNDNVQYQVIEYAGQIVAVASADVQTDYCCAEMTDFATLPAHRGQGFAHILLSELEAKMKKQNILNLHTLARASSPGMNRTFAKMGYALTGALIKNCHISGQFEDMNCWGKRLKQ